MVTPRYLFTVVLALFALAAHAQRRPAPAPLPPRVVRLDSGQTLRRPLYGITADAYQQLRAERSTDQEVHRLDSVSLAVASTEIARLRQEVGAAYEQLRQQRALTDKALARPGPPMLLDINYYRGVGSGFLAGFATGFGVASKLSR